MKKIIEGIRPLDGEAMKKARERQESLAKPPGSLGHLEEISVRMAGITGKLCNQVEKRRILVLAADNGVVEEGVSSAPQSVTASQCINMTMNKTGMSALAHFFGDEVLVTDVGIAADYVCDKINNQKIRYGTANILNEPAMTREEFFKAIQTGIGLAVQAKREGVELAGVGEMGIGNTTTSAAVLHVLTGESVEAVTGRGGGLTDEAFLQKKRVIEKAVRLRKPDKEDIADILSKVGGLDLAAMTGVYLGCAHERLPVVADGFISVTAALCAVTLCPLVKGYLFLSHESAEPGYEAARGRLGLPAHLRLAMRLGEGSGCPLMFQVIRGACGVMNGMATFAEAAINDDYLTEIRQMGL